MRADEAMNRDSQDLDLSSSSVTTDPRYVLRKLIAKSRRTPPADRPNDSQFVGRPAYRRLGRED